MSKKTSIYKIISILLTISFVLNGLVLPQSEETHSQKLYIPPKWGHFQTSSHSPRNDPDVIIIADSHCVPDVQRRIHFILRLLAKQGFHHVALEGAQGNFNTGFFQTMADSKTARRVADYWMNEGALTGAELASIFSRDEIHLYGIEARTPYLKSLGIVRKARKLSPEVEKSIVQLENEIPHVQLILEKSWNDFQAIKGSLSGILKTSFLNLGPYGFLFFPELMTVLQNNEIADFMQFWMEIENLRYLAEESEAMGRSQIHSIRVLKFP